MKVVIIGGGYGGLSVAANLSRQHTQTDITLIDQHPAFSHRIRWHQLASGQEIENINYKQHATKNAYRFIQATVNQIKPEHNAVYLSHSRQIIHYDILVYALGSRPRPLPVPPLRIASIDSSPGTCAQDFPKTCWHFDSSAKIHLAHDQLRQAKRILVIGGGLSGVEYCTELATRYPDKHLTLATASKLLPGYSQQVRAYTLDFFSRHNIHCQENARITGLSDNTAYFGECRAVEFDACIAAIGMTPTTVAGLEYLPTNHLAVNKFLCSQQYRNIFVIGDAAASQSEDAAPMRGSCATAMFMAPTVSHNITQTIKQQPLVEFNPYYLLHCISLGRNDGLLQFVTPDDRMVEKTVTGKQAVQVKEQICKAVVSSLNSDQTGRQEHPWPDFEKLASLLPASS